MLIARRHLPVRRPAAAFEGIRKRGQSSRAPARAIPRSRPMPAARLPLTTHLADRVRAILLADPSAWHRLPQR